MAPEPVVLAGPSASALALGTEALRQGDAASAITHFTHALAAGGDMRRARLGLAVGYALAQRVSDLAELVRADGSSLERLVFLQAVLLEIVAKRAWQVLPGIAEAFAGDAHLRAVAVYYRGAALIAQSDYDAAWPCFEEFKSIVIPRHREFPLASNEEFNLIFRQACLIEPPDRVAALAEVPLAAGIGGMLAVSAIGDWRCAGEGPVFLCCCDGRYFRRFAAELCQSLAFARPGATLHLHVSAPQEADLDLAQSLRARHPALTLNLSVETTPLFAHAVYYACNRFLVAPLLLRHYARPLVTLDADSLLLDDLDAIIEAAGGADFACFNTGRIEPASVFQATLMYFAPSAGALRLLDLLGRLVLDKLSMPPVLAWMLDQAALYSAIRYAERSAPEIAIVDLTTATGREMRSFVGALGTMAEKRDLMNGRV